MRVFLAGAGGAIGTRLVPQLVDQGHEVVGTFNSANKAPVINALGAEAVQLDLLDPAAVRRAVLQAKPDAIVHEATALANRGFSRRLDRTFADTNRLRTKGTDALLAAAREARVGRFVAQSFAPYRYARVGGWVKTEDDPLDSAPSAGTIETFGAMAYLDHAVTEAGGIALRYGGFYGDADNSAVKMVRKRWFPIIGNGEGVTSFVHLDDAARATVIALEYEGPAIFNIVDDEPAALRDWVPVLANILGAKPARHFPAWVARLIAGQDAVNMGTQTRGASNAKAKNELGWELRYPSWRDGFEASYAAPAPNAHKTSVSISGTNLRRAN